MDHKLILNGVMHRCMCILNLVTPSDIWPGNGRVEGQKDMGSQRLKHKAAILFFCRFLDL